MDVGDSFDAIQAAIELGEKAIHELAEIRATLLVNFGEGRHLADRCNLGDGKGCSTQSLMFRVLEALTFPPDAKRAESRDETTVAVGESPVSAQP